MSWSLIAHTAAAPGPSGGATGSINTTGADILFVHISDYRADSTTLTDSKSNTWNLLTASDDGVFVRSRWYYATSPNVGAGHTFTGTSASSSFPVLCVLAFSGAAASPFDVQSGGTTGNATSLQPGSITPSVNGELVLVGLANADLTGGTVSIDSGFTISDQISYGGSNNFEGAAAYLIQTSAAAVNPTWSWTNTADGATRIASFKVSAGGGGGSPLFRTPLLNGLGAGGPFFNNPLGRHRQPGNPQPWAKANGIYRKAA